MASTVRDRVDRCPACGSGAARRGPASRRNGQVVARCRSCGARYLANPPKALPTYGLDDLSTDYVAGWVDNKRESVGTVEWRRQLDWFRIELRGVEHPRLYNVGAGDGEFLALARDEYGFSVGGNDILEAAVLLAKERYNVALDLGDLRGLHLDGQLDAVTLWCVLAHVSDSAHLVEDVAALLKPGGLLFLQTPHFTAADRTFHAAKTLTGGHLSRLSDRRLAIHHRILHTRKSITAQLSRSGFTDIEVTPQARYSLSSRTYLQSLRTPDWALGPTAKAMDAVINGPLAPRIVLDVRARRAIA